MREEGFLSTRTHKGEELAKDRRLKFVREKAERRTRHNDAAAAEGRHVLKPFRDLGIQDYLVLDQKERIKQTSLAVLECETCSVYAYYKDFAFRC